MHRMHKQYSVIDTSLILLKQMLILQREDKIDIDGQKLVRTIVDYAKREVYNKKMYKKSNFNGFWYNIIR